MSKRNFLLAGALSLLAPLAMAQTSEPPIRVIIPLGPGTPSDFLTRIAATAMAVSGARRSTLAPEIPTVAEGGVPGFAVTSWFGLYGPKNLPPEIAKRMNEEVNKVLRSPEVIARFAAMGIEATPMTPVAFADMVAKDTVRWRNVVRDAKIKLD